MNELDDTTGSVITLDTLPVEIFLHICSFLDAKFLTESVSLVCKRFSLILADEAIWRSRLKKRWPDHKIALMEFCGSNTVRWCNMCYHIEDEMDLWMNKQRGMKRMVWKDKHYSCVDAVKLLNNGRIVASGSRDRTLALWDVVNGSEEPLAHSISAHSGWIWGLAAHDDSLYSCSWDSTIKLWKYDSVLQEVLSFQCSGSVLSLACKSQLVAAGLFNNTGIELFDPRCKDLVAEYSPHRLAITALALAGDNTLVSASEDRTIAVWDLRTYKPVIANLNVSCANSFPMSMYYSDNLLYIGDSKNYLHVVSINKGVYKKRDSYQLGKNRYKLTSVWHGRGCVMVGSTDRSVRIFAPTQPLELITDLNERTGEVATIDYCSPVLAVGCTDNSIEVWRTEDAFT